ncbi:MAG: Hpt domain-containing protein [Alphaproteobacteria bacterium]|nr:Hpt domain-containing protein [Alphaproteobacteria bacterium]
MRHLAPAVVAKPSVTSGRRTSAHLGALGFQARPVRSRDEALQLCSQADVALVVLGEGLLDAGLIEALGRARAGGSALPRVVAVTRGQPTPLEPVDAWLRAPWDGPALQQALERAGALRRPDRSTLGPLLELMRRSPDVERLREVLLNGLEDMPELARAAREAARAGDLEGARRAAHRMKGSAATLGLTQLRDACQLILDADAPRPSALRRLEAEALAARQGLLLAYREAGLLR